jgi:hypothetical protein
MAAKERKRHPNQSPDPTPDEIAAACEVIQAAWSDVERRIRIGMQPQPKRLGRPPIATPRVHWMPPVYPDEIFLGEIH